MSLVGMAAVTPLIADSTLNFPIPPGEGPASISLSVQNPTPYFADVEFTLYEADGSAPSASIANPVSYRVPPYGEISLGAAEIFHTDQVQGWIQAKSVNSSLRGSYLWGDGGSVLDGGPAPESLSVQVLPLTAHSTGDTRRVIVLNPAPSFETFLITVFDQSGSAVARTTANIEGRGLLQFELDIFFPGLPSGDLNVIISASAPVAATATVVSSQSAFLVRGQPADRPSRQRVIPHPIGGPIVRSIVLVSNPTAFLETVSMTFFRPDGTRILPTPFSQVSLRRAVPAQGIVSIAIPELLGIRYAQLKDGWIHIGSDNVALGVLLRINEGESRTAIEARDAPVSTSHYPHVTAAAPSLQTQLFLINTSSEDANATVGIVRASGRVDARTTIVVPAGTSLAPALSELGLETAAAGGGVLAVESTVPLYGFALMRSIDGAFLAPSVPVETALSVAAAAAETLPEIRSLDPLSVQPSGTLTVYASRFGPDPAFLVSGREIPASVVDPDAGLLTVELPADLSPGFISVKLRNEFGNSRPVGVRVESGTSSLADPVLGRAFYQKINLTAEGLQLDRPVMVPVRNAIVEAIDPASDQVLSVSQTDRLGWFRVVVPDNRIVRVRISSRLRDFPMEVLDNQNQNAPYTIESSLDPDSLGRVLTLVAVDENRVSGAFNILEVLQRANGLIRYLDPALLPGRISVFWSPENTPGDGTFGSRGVQSSFFDPVRNAAYLVGDRSVDSDEFDDPVILHEYAHFLAERFSRDDSRGGPHFPGDMLDPRVAWSEGWANFFAGLVQGHPDYRDSSGLAGAGGIGFDLEANSAELSRPGYWDEFSVHSLLWDLVDIRDDPGDQVSWPYSLVWKAFTDLREETFVYLPVFLDRILERMPDSAVPLQDLTMARNILFRPFMIPSLADPVPKPLEIGAVRVGELDSFSSGRTNLLQSSHLYAFDTSGGNVSVEMSITGTGPAGRSDKNDLDLLLMNSEGAVIARSDRGLNGHSERIAIELEPGRYVVEIRSFYTEAETDQVVFNSGQYELSLVHVSPANP